VRSALAQAQLRKGDTFIDVGANIGYYALLASQIVGESGHVMAIEPLPANVRALRATIARNHIQNIELRPVAAAACSSSITLHVLNPDAESGWASVVPSDRRRATIEVPASSVDEYLDSAPISDVRLVKIDVEGYEPSPGCARHCPTNVRQRFCAK
jgi:FkbM family methyltransferase